MSAQWRKGTQRKRRARYAKNRKTPWRGLKFTPSAAVRKAARRRQKLARRAQRC